ncbi:hypothetical protein STSO111631_17915 [Stackebrandtia soli]
MLCAGACAPIAAAATGAGTIAVAAVGVLGGIGGQALSSVVSGIVDRLKTDKGEQVAEEVVAAALEQRFDELLYENTEFASELRTGIANLFEKTDAVAEVVAAAIKEGDGAILTELRALAVDHVEFRPLLIRISGGVDEALRRLERIETRQEADRELTWRILRHVENQERQPEPVDIDWHGQAPYCGLSSFQEDQAAVFFGRERSTEEVVYRAASSLYSGGILVVTGASGAGKSSLLHAGFIPAVSAGRCPVPGADEWPHRVMTPGTAPMERLAGHLASVSGAEADQLLGALRDAPEQAHDLVRDLMPDSGRDEPARLILVVDQFEELFTLVDDETERKAFIVAIESIAAGGSESSGLVVLGLRGDFVDRCANYRELIPALQDNAFVVGPMSVDELRQVITGPAAAAGIELEKGLADDILAGLHSSTGDGDIGPAVLPLLSQAMLMTWRRRDGDRLTRRAYLSFGGVSKAVQASAESFYSTLDPDDKKTAHDLFRLMTTVSGDGRLTRRPATYQELFAVDGNADTVLERATAERLVVKNATTAEIAHDVLLVHWRRLREWMEPERESLALWSQWIDDAAEWRAGAEDSSFLYRGTRLEAVEHERRHVWNEDTKRFNPPDGCAEAFLEASRSRSGRRRRVRRVVTSSLVALVVLASIMVGQVLDANQELTRQRNSVLSDQLAAESAKQLGTDGELAKLLAAAAWKLDNSDKAFAAMTTAVDDASIGLVPDPDALDSVAVAFSADGSQLASRSDTGAMTLWDTETWKSTPFNGEAPVGTAANLEFSPDGSRLAANVREGIGIWNTASHDQEMIVGDGIEAGISVLKFSPDGSMLAGASYYENRAWVWDSDSGKELLQLEAGKDETINTLAFTTDGAGLLTGDLTGNIRRWSIDSGREVDSWSTGSAESVTALWNDSADGYHACTDRGCYLDIANGMAAPQIPGSYEGLDVVSRVDRLLALGYGTFVGVWDAETLDLVAQVPARDVSDLELWPGSEILVAGTESGIQLWDLEQALPAPSWTLDSRLSWKPELADDLSQATATNDDGTAVWNFPTEPGSLVDAPSHYSERSGSFSELSPDGSTVATVVSHTEGGGEIDLWDSSSGELLATLPDQEVPVDILDFSGDGRLLASATSATSDGSARVWDTRTGEMIMSFPGHENGVWSLSLSDDATTLATIDGRSVRLWDVRTSELKKVLKGNHGVWSGELLFSHDGSALADGYGGSLNIWDVETGERHTISARDLNPELSGADVESFSFSSDDNFIAVEMADGSDSRVAVWDIDRAMVVYELSISKAVDDIQFSSDGREFAVSASAVTYIFDFGFLRDPHSAVCDRVGRGLTDREWEEYLPEISRDSLTVCG